MPNLLRPSDEDIRMMDLILNSYIEEKLPSSELKPNRTDSFFATLLGVDRQKAKSLMNETLELGSVLGLWVSQKSGYGDSVLVRANIELMKLFKGNGGFDEHFHTKEVDEKSGGATYHTNIGTFTGTFVQGSDFSEADFRPEIKPKTKEIVQPIPHAKRNLLSSIGRLMLKYTWQIFIALFVAYIIYKLGWN
jgi:hypothetical protein